MKTYLFHLITACSCLLLLQNPAQSQVDNPNNDINGELYGNPYIIKDWSEGLVKFTSGRIVNQFKLRFDCVRNQLILQFQGSTFAAESKVKEFVMYTNSGKKKDSLVFRKGYPAIDKGNENTYYQVLLEGKTQLLRLIAKNVVEEKELIASARARGRLEEEEKYYLLKEGTMILLPPDRAQILNALPGQATALAQFITDNNLRFRTQADYIQLAKKYNELL
jgi:hypothetical protein